MSAAAWLHGVAYRGGSWVFLLLLRIPVVSAALSGFARVWHRQSRIATHLRSGGYDQVVDGGANIGEFAALVRAVAPATPLLCVEPLPGAAAVLRRRGFSVVEGALWREEGAATLTQPAAASTSATLLPASGARGPTWEVRTMRLDALPLTGTRILVKLDLQGAEPTALEGLEAAWHRVAGLLLEVSYGPGGTYEPLRSMLAARGFHEAATFNELEAGGKVVEADKLWLRSSPAGGPERPA